MVVVTVVKKARLKVVYLALWTVDLKVSVMVDSMADLTVDLMVDK